VQPLIRKCDHIAASRDGVHRAALYDSFSNFGKHGISLFCSHHNGWRDPQQQLVAPNGAVASSSNWSPVAGDYCFTGASLNISRLAANQLGTWTIEVPLFRTHSFQRNRRRHRVVFFPLPFHRSYKSEGSVHLYFDAIATAFEVSIDARGFKPLRRTGVVIDVNGRSVVDASLSLGEASETATVSQAGAHVETVDTQMGEAITAKQMMSVPLNGRSYTDLLALQSGVVPTTSLTSSTSQDVGVSAFSPSGNLNPGAISINGQPESANSFILNGSDVEKSVNEGTAVIPNLDSIAEFRIITSNFDAEHGEFSGGQISVVTSPGGMMCMAMSSISSVTPISMPATSSLPRAVSSTRISLGERSADRSGGIRCFSSSTIRGPAHAGSRHRSDRGPFHARPDRQSGGSC
jgi:hypothetical protein